MSNDLSSCRRRKSALGRLCPAAEFQKRLRLALHKAAAFLRTRRPASYSVRVQCCVWVSWPCWTTRSRPPRPAAHSCRPSDLFAADLPLLRGRRVRALPRRHFLALWHGCLLAIPRWHHRQPAFARAHARPASGVHSVMPLHSAANSRAVPSSFSIQICQTAPAGRRLCVRALSCGVCILQSDRGRE